MYRLHAVAVALFMGLHVPAIAATEAIEDGQAQTTAPAANTGIQASKKNTGTSHSKPGKKRQSSEFVRLGRLLVDNRFVFNTFNDLGLNAFDPTITDRVLATEGTRWAFGRIDTGTPDNNPPRETASSRTIIAIRPLDLDSSDSHPFYGDPYRLPGRTRSIPALDTMSPFGAIAGLDNSFFTAPFPGPDDSGTDFTVGAHRAPLAYRLAMDKKTSVNAGVTWIHDLSDATGMSPALEDPGSDGASANKLPGVNLSLGASYKAVTFTGGYIRALDSRTSTDLALAGKEDDPVAWNSEIAYSTELLRRETTLAVGYQRSSDALQSYLPEERYRTRASMALTDSTVFSLEYYQDREVVTGNGEEDGYGITTKIGVGF